MAYSHLHASGYAFGADRRYVNIGSDATNFERGVKEVCNVCES